MISLVCYCVYCYFTSWVIPVEIFIPGFTNVLQAKTDLGIPFTFTKQHWQLPAISNDSL